MTGTTTIEPSTLQNTVVYGRPLDLDQSEKWKEMKESDEIEKLLRITGLYNANPAALKVKSRGASIEQNESPDSKRESISTLRDHTIISLRAEAHPKGESFPDGTFHAMRSANGLAPSISETSASVIRSHYIKQIIRDLTVLATKAQTPSAAMPALSLLRTIRRMRDELPYDTWASLMLALHDSLSYKDKWSVFSASQYQQAVTTIKTLYSSNTTVPKRILKGIMDLEKIGFDTTPFEIHEEVTTENE